MPRLYALIDCNSFYVSCERLFEPKLRDRAVVVLSNNDGCVVSRSKEAKKLPVAMGVPLYQVQHFVDAGQLVARSSNYTLYGDLSQRVMSTLASFGHPQEVYSIDECFLDFTADGSPERTAIQMRSQVLHDVGIPTGVGLGWTKTLAKLASKLAKNQANGVFAMPPPGPALAEVLGGIPVGDVWGIGRRISETLISWGVHTALDLARFAPERMRSNYGVVGARIVQELRGESCVPFIETLAPRKTITVSRSFGRDIAGLDELLAAVCSFAEMAGERLRAQGLAAGKLRTWVEHNRFRDDAPQCSGSCDVNFPIATDLNPELIGAASASVRHLWTPTGRWKKAGVLLEGLVLSSARQESFLDAFDRPRLRSLMTALDAVNGRHGGGAIACGTRALSARWRPLAEHGSPRYTTRWDELPIVG